MSNIKNQANKNVLALQLTRNIKIQRFPIIAKVTFKRERPDLVSLLKSMENNAVSMPARLKAYLKNEKLWDAETSSLTDKGQAVKSSGLYSATERGLYHIWYINNDPLLGTRPILIQRDTAFFEPNTKGWLKGVDAARSDYRVDVERQVVMVEEIYDGRKNSQNKKTLSLVSIIPEVICSSEKSATLELNWSLGQSSSIFVLKGQLDLLDFSQKKTSHRPVTIDMSIEECADKFHLIMDNITERLEGRWDNADSRMAIDLEHIQQYPSATENFRIGRHNLKYLQTNCGEFDSVETRHIPIKPTEQLDAEQWHNQWLENFYNKSYQISKAARQQQAQWIDNPALNKFELPLKSGANLFDSLNSGHHSKAFWHAAAMSDLTPSKSKKLRLPISLVNGDSLSLEQLICQLTGGELVEKVIYSDRYVHTPRQRRNLAAVATCVSDAEGLLLTLESQRGNEAILPDNWVRVALQKQNDNHGRYWIFIGSTYTYCWECSSGLDFIRDMEAGLVVDGTPGFTPKEEDELPRYLQDSIQAVKLMEVV
ncbi:MAG: hypothetical protein JKY50_05895 [Oleispira sp.]|nr:hypothetical protein [Oleispira sp.]MBL4880550.1 hypothetical protein [Oleispira sp.]